ncbi:MAG: FmdB family zinc ribbon protein, partial [Actinomycetota bacterium]
MPTYEYECTSCGQHIEVFQRISEEALTTCGVCGGSLRKVFHPAGIVFKGSGFYATDSRSGSRSEGKSEGKKDTKKETKKDAGGGSPPPPSSSSSSSSSASEGGSTTPA